MILIPVQIRCTNNNASVYQVRQDDLLEVTLPVVQVELIANDGNVKSLKLKITLHTTVYRLHRFLPGVTLKPEFHAAPSAARRSCRHTPTTY